MSSLKLKLKLKLVSLHARGSWLECEEVGHFDLLPDQELFPDQEIYIKRLVMLVVILVVMIVVVRKVAQISPSTGVLKTHIVE